MAKRKTKVAVVPPSNAKEANEVMASYAKANSKIAEIKSKMEKDFTKIREKYADEISENVEIVETSFEKMQIYAQANSKLFEKKKSLETSHGTIGFRKGQFKLKNKKGFTWAAVLELLKAKGKKGSKYIRSKEEIAKDLLLANREDEKCMALMDEIKIDVVQDETFFIDLKKEDTEV